ncbi:MAG TPA: fused MFS/spermidine synthase [Chloroflexota bacterium]|nr:fused MFS/spermidine synthase [Chloroflexota bacterium]
MAAALLAASRAAPAPCLEESRYYCISVSEWRQQELTLRALLLDRQVHGINALEDPTHLELAYLRTYARLTERALDGRDQPAALLFVGGGAYTFPRYVEATRPDAELDVVEIDPRVTAVAHAELGLSGDTRVRSHGQDARLWLLEQKPPARYDIVYGDAFNDLVIPYHLTTHEFNGLVRAALKPDGWYLANVIDDPVGGTFLGAYVRTLRLSYPRVYVFAEPSAWPASTAAAGARAAQPRTFVVAATADAAEPPALPTRLTQEEVAAILARSPATLTDDYAPVDNLLLPALHRRGF